MKVNKTPGVQWSKDASTFILWAPSSLKAELRLYSAGSEEEAPSTCAQYTMTRGEGGFFSCTVNGDLHCTYYDFCLTDIYGHLCVTADPQAKACGLNGTRSMVVDLTRTDPPGWGSDRAPRSQDKPPVIWETHVKDFSFSPSSGVRPEWRGKYLAFTEEHTATPDGFPTCISYLKHLGVTHVQLLPIADFASVNEDDSSGYNWGYDIGNYNVPEGSYATDPRNGEVRIRECKRMIQALHRAGLGVVLDVVYNHTYRRHSWLDRCAPGQYYRHDETGNHMNGSGCGNETASELEPFRQYMLRSVLYWAKEYHVDGFRFDLMGVHDVETMNMIRAALDELPDGKNILMIGEPWAGGTIGLKAPHLAANKENVKKLDARIGIFSDQTRTVLAGSVFEQRDIGYPSGRLDEETLTRLKECMTGLCLPEKEGQLISPTQAVQYASCHDNHTLWDRLTAQAGSEDYDALPDQLLRRQKLVSGLYLTSLGIGFMQSGEEFCRTKHGDGNSYRGPAALNALDWDRASGLTDMVDWYSGLIGLRRQLMPQLSVEAAKGISFLPMQGDGCIAQLRKMKKGSRFGSVLIYINPSPKPVAVQPPEGLWTMLCDGERSDLWKDASQQAPSLIALPPVSLVILGK